MQKSPTTQQTTQLFLYLSLVNSTKQHKSNYNNLQYTLNQKRHRNKEENKYLLSFKYQYRSFKN